METKLGLEATTHYQLDDQLINWLKKKYFVKIKFYSDENIEWNCTKLELKWNEIQTIECVWIEFKNLMFK